MKINHGEIVAIAQDYIDCRNTFMRKYPGPNYITHQKPEMYDAYRQMQRAERALDAVCYAVNLSPVAAIMAARIINRTYEIAYAQGRDPGTIDEQRVLEALEANA